MIIYSLDELLFLFGTSLLFHVQFCYFLTFKIGRASCRERVETVSDFIFLGSKITADGDYSHEIKRCSLLGRKVMTNLDSILKSRGYYFANKGPSSQGYGFSSGDRKSVV